MHHFMNWIGSWVTLFQSIVEILSLGFIHPNWEMKFVVYEFRRSTKQTNIYNIDNDIDIN